MKIVLDAFKIIEKKTGQNPVQVLVNAIEKSSPRDEITVIEYGGARYPQAVDVSPLRRVNLTLRWIVHGASDRAFKKKKAIRQGLAEEIMLAAEASGESLVFKKKNPEMAKILSDFGWSNDLRSATEGRGVSSIKDQLFEPVPRGLQADIIRKIRSRKGLSENQ